MVPDSPGSPDRLFGEMSILRSPDRAHLWRTVGWRLFQLLTLAALAWAGWRLLSMRVHIDDAPYRIDIDVYRMGGRAWLDGHPLYSDGAMFHTRVGLDLPFTYPPLAAIVFAPFAWLSLSGAGAVITVITLLLLVVSTWIVLTRLRVWDSSQVATGPAWLRRGWLAAAIVAPAVVYLEPIRSNFDFGQINVVLMTLVIADCVPRRTPWPRGLLLGVAIALKLTPAVFLLVLPAAPGHPCPAGHGGVGGGRHAGRVSRWPGRTRSSTGPRPCTTPTGSARRRSTPTRTSQARWRGSASATRRGS